MAPTRHSNICSTIGVVNDDGPSEAALAALARTAAAFTTLRRAFSQCLAAVHELELDQVAAEVGHTGTARLLEELARLDRGEARRLVRHATALHPALSPTGTPTPPALPACAASLHD